MHKALQKLFLGLATAMAVASNTKLDASLSHLVGLNMGVTFPSSFGGEPPNPKNLPFEEVTNLPGGYYAFSHQMLWNGKIAMGVELSTFNRGLFLEEDDDKSPSSSTENAATDSTTAPTTVLRHSTEKSHTLLGVLGSYYAEPYDATGTLYYGFGAGVCVAELLLKTSRTTGSVVSLEAERDHQFKLYWAPQVGYSIRLNERASVHAALKQSFYLLPFEMHSAVILGLTYEVRYRDKAEEKNDE